MALPPGLSRSRNLSDVRSRADSFSNLLPVNMREPTGNDNSSAYVVGQSLWRAPVGQLSQLQSLMPTGKAQWTPISNPGPNPGSVISGAVFHGWTQRVVSGYTGNLFTLVRHTDGASLDIGQQNGYADFSLMAGFLSTTGGIGYISKVYNQNGSGNDATQTLIASMPRVDMSTVVGGTIPWEIDSTRRAYWLGIGTMGNGLWFVSWPGSGNVVTLNLAGATGATGSISGTTATLGATAGGSTGFWRIGMVLSGTGVTAGTTLVAPIQITDATGAGQWQVSISQTVASTVITGSLTAVPPDILPGQYVTGGGTIATASFTATISGTQATIVSITSGTIANGQLMQNAAAGTVIGTNVSGGSTVGSVWNINVSQTVASAAAFIGTTTVAAVNYTTGAITLSTTPLLSTVSISLNNPGVFLDLPNAVQVPWQTWGTIFAAKFGASGAGNRPIAMGIHGNDPLNNAGSFSLIDTPAFGNSSYGFRWFNGNNVGSGASLGGSWQATEQIWAFSNTGTGGRDLNYQFDGIAASATVVAPGNLPASTLSGGCIGYNKQLTTSTANGVDADALFYGISIYPSTVSLAQFNILTASINEALNWFPQVQEAITCDGSSTTAGNGTITALCWPEQMSLRLCSVAPKQVYAPVSGGTIENSVGLFSVYSGKVPANKRELLIFHPGAGNSLQASGNFTATGTSGNVITVNTANTGLTGVGVQLSGTNLVAGTSITAFTTTNITVNPPPIGTVGSFSIIGDTATQAWASLEAYFTQAATFGFGPFVLISSASRGGYTTPQLVEWNTLATFMRENWQTLPGVVGFLNLEDDPYFGSDGNTMVVQSISGGNVTVQATTPYVAVGNRVRWSGMPFSIVNDTGGQTFATVSGTTFTVSGSLTGLNVGDKIQAINPAPWSVYPGEQGLGLNSDRQHYCKQAYWRIGNTVAQYVLENSIV